MELDCSKIGFKCGIEIHQQLDTKKLFCTCPSIVRDSSPDIKIQRRLRAVAGETGGVDKAAAYEKSKDKKFIYEACSTSACLVELDEEPPHSPNEKALKIALEISMLLNANIVDEIQFMRKTVIDGSNVSGFQRTALIARDGYIQTSKGKVNIPIICLEEEAAKKIDAKKDYTKYRLDRLGIPLIEIGTAPDIRDPEHAKEVAGKLGMILRSTGKVKRGLGTIRQDVNISIKSGARTEIKGFQDLKSIPRVINYEISRQLSQLKAGKKIRESVRKAEPDFTNSYLRPMPGADRMYPETDVKTIRITKQLLDSIELPELITEKIKKLETHGIGADLAKKVIKQDKQDYFIAVFNNFEALKPSFIVEAFFSVPNKLSRDFSIPEKDIKHSHIEHVLKLINNAQIPKSALENALADIVKGEFYIEDYKTASEEKVEKEIIKIVTQKPGLNPGAYMGIIMARFKGKIDGKKAMQILKKVLK
ncbi:Glu-tRNA(Gln) amidotransferase subunit GatE [Candidatus Woesearchaeota archaeon]|nr:Glu-tRNA(Gln) amidotransferase subunit GatE [Candidatus Woesearchaeota archaeon]